jgi:hypothetical protein
MYFKIESLTFVLPFSLLLLLDRVFVFRTESNCVSRDKHDYAFFLREKHS